MLNSEYLFTKCNNKINSLNVWKLYGEIMGKKDTQEVEEVRIR